MIINTKIVLEILHIPPSVLSFTLRMSILENRIEKMKNTDGGRSQCLYETKKDKHPKE